MRSCDRRVREDGPPRQPLDTRDSFDGVKGPCWTQPETADARTDPYRERKGPLVPRKRPAASNVMPPALTCLDGGRSDDDGPLLSRADAHALRLGAARTHARLKEHLGPRPLPPGDRVDTG
jgi:hypothetical protein